MFVDKFEGILNVGYVVKFSRLEQQSLVYIFAPVNYFNVDSANTRFGESVSIFNETIAIGASGDGMHGNKVYIYNTNDLVNPTQTIMSPINNISFGAHVAMYDDILIISAPMQTQPTGFL
jgi:hypothetical protein